ncbi:kinase-like domain-containing protein [Rhizophagus irregularis DAOM 181602=DAOM 197198]|nr:kinase-like domain-containing protein [Rhizophagus irregularis DAOM 181602=DAOM 197198]
MHPNNILINDGKIKVADFGRSCQRKGSVSHTKAHGVIPYMDPKFFEQNLIQKYGLTEKSDIYSLGVLFWELTSRSSPFNFEKKRFDRDSIKLMILNRVRENPIPKTNDKFVSLYKKCWQHEPDERPPICQVIEELDNIDPIINNLPTNSNKSKITQDKDSDLNITTYST